MIGIDSSVRHLHGQPAANGIKTPEVIVAAQEIVPTLSQLLLLHTTKPFVHLRTSRVSEYALLKMVSAMAAETILI